ncbi:antiviral reverse transcriptase Drt4 [Caballeronia sp. GAWG1-1]|uniref:antiviral reverse transcriptase Drt4 n=1 Tax=Caballeronia sp. GAWG1-1 TaxID=2921742 RepID=UPI00253FAF63|nr:antiviral reverse transcriptase Drt4 [Caballeronia sp. GAWG1-1]
MPYDTQRHIFEGLTRWNYLPNQKAPVGEVPPSISSRQFTPEVAKELATLEDSRDRKKWRWDDVSYSMTRYDNVPRQLALMHPLPYARLAVLMSTHWNELGGLANSENSAIKPEQHDDGRILIMNYEDALTKTNLALEASFGKRFRVETDIAGCFTSIYSHSIPWAVVGFEAEKARDRNNGPFHWSNKLDFYQRLGRRGETVGLAIGPATSSIIVEIILGRVDEKMREAGYAYRRYIDDYICYCDTHEKAQTFLALLGEYLSEYRLHLNLQKTTIVELPDPLSEPWVTTLGTALESRLGRDADGRALLRTADATQYLDFATRLNRDTRDGSVLKYAVGSMLPHLDQTALGNLAPYLINLCWHYPALLPYLQKLCDAEHELLAAFADELNAIIIENARHRRSDGMAWPLHFMLRTGMQPTENTATAVLNSRDCVACTLLFEIRRDDPQLLAFGRSLLEQGYHERDKYWLLLYQMARHAVLEVHDDEPSFGILLKHRVNFIPQDERKTQAEMYCTYLENHFMEDRQRELSLEEWTAAEGQAVGNGQREGADDPFGA